MNPFPRARMNTVKFSQTLGCPILNFRAFCEILGWGLSRNIGAVLALLVLLVFPGLSSADVLKITLNDTIQPVTDEFIGRALAEAKAKNDQALLIEINTPGGLVESTREIIEKIVDSPVPVIVYVTPSGSRAASAGFFILESADVAAMAPGTNTGAAHPVTLGGSKMDDVMKQKIENDLAALMRSVASRRGRSVDIAESGVRESKSFTEQEALTKKLIDYVASSEDDLFRQLAGHPIKRFDGNVDLALAAYNAGPTAVEKLGRAPSLETLRYAKNIEARAASLAAC